MKERIKNLRSRLRSSYYCWKCWFLFHHHMESLGPVGPQRHMYQCTFCFKRIVVRPFGSDKGVVETKMPLPVPPEAYNRRSAVGAKVGR